MQAGGVDYKLLCYSDGSLVGVTYEGNPYVIAYDDEDNSASLYPAANYEGYPITMSGVTVLPEQSYVIEGYTVTYDSEADVSYISPAVSALQRPLYSHEYTYGNFITNGERNQSNNMKAAYITVGGAVQLFKKNTTAGKWVTVPNDNNLALMDAPLTAFESGPPSDFQFHGFVFTFSAGDVDGYTVAPALSII